MNRFGVIFLMVLSTSFAEPPSTYGVPEISTSYGLPSGWESVSSGYAYQPQAASTHYEQHHVGHIPSEGAHIDAHLLEKVKQVILAHEQNSGSSNVIISKPSSSYGPPGWQSTGWVSRVTDLHFDHPIQSHPAAYYVGHDTYAPTYTGWSKPSTGWSKPSTGWAKPSSGWAVASTGWEKPSTGWEKPSTGWQVANKWAPSSHTVVVERPQSTYGVPKW